jgi:hypothetical protein
MRRQQQVIEACQTSLLPAIERGILGLLPGELRYYMSRLARRNLERLRLSLIAYRIDHGELPQSLRDREWLRTLVPDYLPRGIALDPFSMDWFEYRPNGLDLPLATEEMTNPSQFIPAGTPLLWSVGPGFVELEERWAHVALDDKGQATVAWLNSEYDAEQRLAGETLGEARTIHVMMLVSTTGYMSDQSTIVLPIPSPAGVPTDDEENASAGDSRADDLD